MAITSSRGIESGPVAGPDDVVALNRILSWSFSIPEVRLTKACEQIGHESLRVLRDAGRVQAGYVLHTLGQWFGGRRVSMAGVGMVGVAPEARGRGLATRLMDDAIREYHASGFAISTLFPAKQALYRRSGYERAGARWHVQVELDRLAVIVHDEAKPGAARTLRAATPADVETIHGLYDRFVAAENGPIHRNAFLWDRRMNVPEQDTRGFLVEGSEGPEGYCFLYQERKQGFRSALYVADHVALTAAAARTLLSFYADHRSMGSTVEWFGCMHDPFLTALREARISCDLFFPWMIRIVDVQRAFAERGYPVGLETEIHLAVQDELIPANQDRFVVTIASGAGEARRGGKGTITLGIRGLASMWAGFLSPRAARACGLLDGPDDELARAAPVFAGPAPWMPDMF